MTKLRILIADDEPLARDRLRGFLKGEPDLELVGELSNGQDALTAIAADKPDLVFLDMEMPGATGLQVAQRLGPDGPAIIFVTAHDRFAVEAFALQAIDYLLKPFDRERLQLAVRRAREHLQHKRAGDLSRKLDNILAGAAPAEARSERITVKVDGRVIFLKPEEILWVEAADNYVVIHSPGSRVMLRETLTALESRLSTTQFARISRSAIVNLDEIRELQPNAHGDYIVILRNGVRLPLSRSLRGQLTRFTG